MKPLNKITIKSKLFLPHIEQQLNALGKAWLYAGFDFFSGFDFLMTHPDSLKYFVLILIFGAWYMLGAPQGWVSTPVSFQNRIQTEVIMPAKLFNVRHNDALQWIDDICLYSDGVENFINSLKRFLQACIAKKVRLNLRKCNLLTTTVTWCGRELSYGK